jgi:hypothetical protein
MYCVAVQIRRIVLAQRLQLLLRVREHENPAHVRANLFPRQQTEPRDGRDGHGHRDEPHTEFCATECFCFFDLLVFASNRRLPASHAPASHAPRKSPPEEVGACTASPQVSKPSLQEKHVFLPIMYRCVIGLDTEHGHDHHQCQPSPIGSNVRQ